MTRKPRLLAVANHRVWPVTDGYSLRVAHLLAELARWWEIAVVATAGVHGSGGLPEGAAVVREVPATGEFESADREALRHAVDELVRDHDPDVLLLWGGAEWVAFGRSDLPPAIGDRIDCMTLTAWRERVHAKGIRDGLRVLRQTASHAWYERRALRQLDAMIVVGESDARVLRQLEPRAEVFVVPNGVAVRGAPTYEAEAPVPTVAFTGVLSHGPNIDAALYFAREVWPLVRERVPDARFVVAGRDPAPPLRELGGTADIDVQANVPDMDAVLRSAWVAVAPMRQGAGIKNKVLEAWAVGKPVVMTQIAANGLQITDAAAPLVVDEPPEMAARITELLSDSVERRRIGAALHAMVGDRHSWSAAGQRVSELLAHARDGRFAERAGLSPRVASAAM